MSRMQDWRRRSEAQAERDRAENAAHCHGKTCLAMRERHAATACGCKCPRCVATRKAKRT